MLAASRPSPAITAGRMASVYRSEQSYSAVAEHEAAREEHATDTSGAWRAGAISGETSNSSLSYQ